MKLDTDVRELVGKKKAILPTKRSMNLYFKVDRTTAPATIALYTLFTLVVLLGAAKLAIYDPWNQEQQLKQQALALEQRSVSQMQELKNYDQVLENYIRSTPTQEELSQADTMEVLDLIDRTIRPAATVSQVTIKDNQVLISFSGITLSRAAELVTQLEQSPLVSNPHVDTAATTKDNQDAVEIHIYFEIAQEESGS